MRIQGSLSRVQAWPSHWCCTIECVRRTNDVCDTHIFMDSSFGWDIVGLLSQVMSNILGTFTSFHTFFGFFLFYINNNNVIPPQSTSWMDCKFRNSQSEMIRWAHTHTHKHTSYRPSVVGLVTVVACSLRIATYFYALPTLLCEYPHRLLLLFVQRRPTIVVGRASFFPIQFVGKKIVGR